MLMAECLPISQKLYLFQSRGPTPNPSQEGEWESGGEVNIRIININLAQISKKVIMLTLIP